MKEYVYEYGAAVDKVDWRNKNKLYLTDFSTRKDRVLIKSDFRASTIDLAIYLDVEHGDLVKLIDVQKYKKAVCKNYLPGELDPSKYDKKFEFYWIPSIDIEKLIIALKERL